MRDRTLLAQLQALPLDAKILMTKQRIREWYNYWHGNVVISFSGGKDSTVLAHLIHEEYPDVPMVFANTGLEYPEIQAFARKIGAEFVRPKMQFSDVISKYGYPIIGKEVAEAISFARRIVPIGGGTTAERKRTEMYGKRNNELIPPPQQKSKEEQAGDAQTLRETRRFPRKSRLELHGTRPVERLTKERTQEDRTSKTATHGERLIGKDGEEKQSPG